MTRTELIEKMATELDISRKQASETIEWVFGAIIDSLKEDNRFSSSGFGSFTVNTRKAREGRNPRTGEKIMVPPRKSIKFNPSPKMKAILNSEPDPEVDE